MSEKADGCHFIFERAVILFISVFVILNGCITYELYHQQRLKQQQMSKTKPRSISKTKESKKESEWVTSFNLPLVSYPD